MRSTLRLLGDCPACRGKDTIVGQNLFNRHVFCERRPACRGDWPDMWELVKAVERAGRWLVPVCIVRHQAGVQLGLPEPAHIPHHQFVTSIIVAALLVRFRGLNPLIGEETRITGIWQGEPISLGSWQRGEIGFCDKLLDRQPNMKRKEILDWCEEFLKVIFMDPLGELGRGAVLMLQGKEATLERVTYFLQQCLRRKYSPSFEKSVLAEVEGLQLCKPRKSGMVARTIAFHGAGESLTLPPPP